MFCGVKKPHFNFCYECKNSHTIIANKAELIMLISPVVNVALLNRQLLLCDEQSAFQCTMEIFSSGGSNHLNARVDKNSQKTPKILEQPLSQKRHPMLKFIS